MLFDVAVLERRPIRFSETFGPGKLNFSGSEWEQAGDLHTVGHAELLDPSGSRTIRVRGTVRGTIESTCSRCLEPVSIRLDGKLDLFYYPMSVIARKEEVAIGRDQTDVGFYEEPRPDVARGLAGASHVVATDTQPLRRRVPRDLYTVRNKPKQRKLRLRSRDRCALGRAKQLAAQGGSLEPSRLL